MLIRPIKHPHTLRRLSPVFARLYRLVIATQHGDPGIGSGDPYLTKDEHADTSAVTVVQSAAEAVGDRQSRISATTIAKLAVVRYLVLTISLNFSHIIINRTSIFCRFISLFCFKLEIKLENEELLIMRCFLDRFGVQCELCANFIKCA